MCKYEWEAEEGEEEVEVVKEAKIHSLGLLSPNQLKSRRNKSESDFRVKEQEDDVNRFTKC